MSSNDAATTKRVLITGTSGIVGGPTAEEFVAHGYHVRAFDKAPPSEALRGKVEAIYGDITDPLHVMRAAEGCDAVVHLAAIPNPMHGTDQIMPVNVGGTANVFAACEAHGIKRVALASTCCTFGMVFAKHRFDPQYFPVDEKHPLLPQDLYGLSKVLVEETAAAYSRRCGMSTVSLRLTMVTNFVNPANRWWKNSLKGDYKSYDFWAYIEARDVARAFRLAIENGPLGESHSLIIAARDTFTIHDVRELARKHFGDLADSVAHQGPSDSLYDTRRAEEVIGFVAEKTWRGDPNFEKFLAE